MRSISLRAEVERRLLFPVSLTCNVHTRVAIPNIWTEKLCAFLLFYIKIMNAITLHIGFTIRDFTRSNIMSSGQFVFIHIHTHTHTPPFTHIIAASKLMTNTSCH